ncbi:MAG: radical SAM protein [Candidatus Omnitrophica bacterium]|jgi:wyosine [tRNA(Phe)-imidazoG37] synthetase (radical SAM superfamily)|nr:radical SAM protein [Candidatus Omnitrophota bacterium]MDD5518136.1 radical SAM protein [Candidatus Omnitrophota bacterium]
MKYLYGPVKSRRLGFSLGISLTPYKTCDFDCIYCQLGKTTNLTLERKEYIRVSAIIDELKTWLSSNKETAQGLEYITLSGSGEPTLNTGCGELITEVKKLTSLKIAVLTNASLLTDGGVRRQLWGADLVVPSLDAVTQDLFARIDRPHPGIKIEEIIAGLTAFRKEFRGKIWLEVMLLKGINDDIRHIRKLKDVIDEISPDRIQLNSPVRTTAEAGIQAVAKGKLKKIKEILGEKAELF